MANLTRLSVLIAESNVERRRETAALLQELGVQRIVHVDSWGALREALGKQAFDVLMCAERLGNDDGVAVLRAARDAAPATRAVLIRTNDRAGELVPQDIEALELPFSRLTLQGLLHRTAAPQGGLWCEVPELSLSDILQMYHQARRSITVLLSGPIAGRIRLEAGEIVDAEASEERGMSALSRLLEAESGLVRTEPPRFNGPRTISAPFQSVILEAAQKLDERRRDSLASPAISSPVISNPSISNPSISSPVIAQTSGVPVGAGGGLASHDPLGRDFLGRDFLDHDFDRDSGEHDSMDPDRVSRDSVGRDLVGHDSGSHERSSVSSDVPRRAMTPMLQGLTPNSESSLVAGPVRRRRGVLLTIGVLAALVLVAVAAPYLGGRARETPALTEPGGSDPTSRDAVVAVNDPSAALPAPLTAPEDTDEAARERPSSGEPPPAGRDVPAARSAQPLPTPGAVPKDAAKPAQAKAPVKTSSFALHITSRPSRATVLEAGRMLGKTPLTVTIGASSVAGRSREFVVGLPGYVSSRVYQGASSSDVTAGVVLVPRAVVADAPDGGADEPDWDSAEARPGNPKPRRKDLGIRLRR